MSYLKGMLPNLKVSSLSLYITNLTDLEGETEEEKAKEKKPPMLVVEIYDPSVSSYKLVREVPLYKNDEQEPFIKKSNSLDYLKEACFGTNG